MRDFYDTNEVRIAKSQTAMPLFLRIRERLTKMLNTNKAARRSCNYKRANGSRGTRSIVADQEQAYLIAGLLIAVSFGLMFVIGAVMF